MNAVTNNTSSFVKNSTIGGLFAIYIFFKSLKTKRPFDFKQLSDNLVLGNGDYYLGFSGALIALNMIKTLKNNDIYFVEEVDSDLFEGLELELNERIARIGNTFYEKSGEVNPFNEEKNIIDHYFHS